MRTYLLPVYALLLLALAGPAVAVDGVLEINETCAVSTGCFSGDTAGYPVTIGGSAGRSYRLTGDLIVPDVNTTGIRVSTSSVTIDLNGFEIVRFACVGVTTNCTLVGINATGIGVNGRGILNRGNSVKNGSITGMGSIGVALGDQAQVSGLRVRWNRTNGISTGAGSTVSGNTAYQNGNFGIRASRGSTVSGNSVYQNSDDGISVGDASVVSDNSVYQNGGDGIVARSGSTVSGNAVHFNSGYGLNLSPSPITLPSAHNPGYRENVITVNLPGTVLGGVDAGGNVCDGSLTCP